MAKRIQSPSSINLFKQCPRRYYYRYIEGLPTKPSIHLIRGSIAHSVLEDFYDSVPESELQIRISLMKLLHKHWDANKEELASLKLSPFDLERYFQETEHMILNFSNQFIDRIHQEMAQGMTLQSAFEKLKPTREIEYISDTHSVRGFIDVIEKVDGKVTILDYKTSKKAQITPDYKLQLAIYALLYHDTHGELPDCAGIFFLKDTTHTIEVDEDLLKLAQFEIEQIHISTESDNILDYRQNVTPLCKWRTGQCDFFETCKPHN